MPIYPPPHASTQVQARPLRCLLSGKKPLQPTRIGCLLTRCCRFPTPVLIGLQTHRRLHDTAAASSGGWSSRSWSCALHARARTDACTEHAACVQLLLLVGLSILSAGLGYRDLQYSRKMASWRPSIIGAASRRINVTGGHQGFGLGFA